MTERKVWGLLLIVDGLFVALFAGALAGKVYVHIVAEPAVIRGSPGPAVVPRKPPSETSPRTAVPRDVGGAPPAAATTVPAAPTAAPPKPAKPSEPPPSTLRVASGTSGRPDGPDSSASPPRPEPPAPTRPGKAQGVEFTYADPKAQKVFLMGGFLSAASGRRMEMEKGEGGLFRATVYLHPGTYKYHFLVDGKRKLDPANKAAERGRSLKTVE